MTSRAAFMLGAAYCAVFVVWLAGECALDCSAAGFAAQAAIVLVLSHTLLAWIAPHWLVRADRDLPAGVLALLLLPLPLHVLVLLMGGTTWAALARTHLALAGLAVLALALGRWLSRRAAGPVTARLALCIVQTVPALLLWQQRDRWLPLAGF